MHMNNWLVKGILFTKLEMVKKSYKCSYLHNYLELYLKQFCECSNSIWMSLLVYYVNVYMSIHSYRPTYLFIFNFLSCNFLMHFTHYFPRIWIFRPVMKSWYVKCIKWEIYKIPENNCYDNDHSVYIYCWCCCILYSRPSFQFYNRL